MAVDEYTPVPPARKRRARISSGKRKTPAWRSYYAMLTRCYNKNSHKYPMYGGRGIKVCDSWLLSFDNFHRDMGDRPAGMTLDRYPDNDGNYEPGNCRWATTEQQSNNKRASQFLEWNGRRQTITQWSRETGIDRSAIDVRLGLGWSVERALTEPAALGKNQYLGKNLVEHEGRRQTIADWAKETGIKHCTIQKRLQKGWAVERALTQPVEVHRLPPKPQ